MEAADDSSSRTDLICDLFLQCTHQEQLALIERLPRLITRDFIAYLPTPLTARILSFLALSDVMVCLRVNKTWKQTVEECEPYWLEVCSSVGVTAEILEKKRYSALMSYALRAWRHALRVRTMFSSKGYMSTVESKHLVHSEAARAYSGGRAQRRQYETSYAGNGNVLCLGKGVGTDALLLHVTLPGTTMYTERGLRVCSGWSITWSFVSKNSKYITFSTSDARWGRLEKGSTEAEYKSLNFWNDTTPVSIGEVRLAGCHKCSLITEVNKTAIAENTWSYRTIELDSSKRAVTQTVSEVNLIIPIRPVNYVHLESIALIPHSGAKSGSQKGKPCQEHFLLLQLGTAIGVYRLTSTLTEPEQVTLLCPYNDPSTVASVLQLGHKFSISSDFSLISLCTANTLHVWSLSKLDLLSMVTIPVHYGSPFQWRCLAVGRLYSLVHNQARVLVVCTCTRYVIQEFSITSSLSAQDMYCLCSPSEQAWLNTISCDMKRVILPVVKGGWYDPEFSIVISPS